MERAATFDVGSASSSAASLSSTPSSNTPSRRNSFTILEKPASPSSKGFSAPRVSLLPMPVLSRASSALDVAKSSLNRSRHGFHFHKEQPPPPEDKGPSAESIWVNYTRLDGYFNGIRSIVPMKQYHPEFPTAADTELGTLQEYIGATNTTLVVPPAHFEKRAENDATSTFSTIASLAQTTQTTRTTQTTQTAQTTSTVASIPKPTIFNAYPDYNSTAYRSQFYPVQRCYLDDANKIPVPDLWAYPGVPQGQPEPLFGSHSLLGLREDVCFDRFGRYGPYGLGYSKEEGGTGLALDTESEGAEHIWSKELTSGKIDYSTVDWASAQSRCYKANEKRFVATGNNGSRPTEYMAPGDLLSMPKQASSTVNAAANSTSGSGLKKIERTAIVMRCYAGFKWSLHSVLNMRALVSELALRSGGEYDIHILLHARDENIPIWADEETAQEFIAENIPREFRGLVSLWSEGQMRMLYPGMRGQPAFSNPSNADIHGVYRSAHYPLQHFAQQHPEYAHYWNWEMDMRFLGSYYEFFNRLGIWADNQPRRRLWERSAKYYIPALHGSWENFTARVDTEAHEAGRPSILGELYFTGRTQTRDEERGVSPLPAGCEGAVLSTYNRTSPADNTTAALPGRHFFADRNNNYTNIPESCGVGEPADLITLNPMFDAEDSGWMFAKDVTGYDLAFAIPPRRTAIITASRLSRRLLFAMHEETWRLHHGMFAEMFPPTVALHRGFKAVYAPHPVYADRHWPLAAAEKAFNAGPDHSSGASPASPFHPSNEHYHRGVTWYYNSNFAGRLWRRWLGYPQPIDDPAAPKPTPVNGTDPSLAGLGGGASEEEEGSGRMCMRSVLVHPIKFESLAEVFA
ncbi:MAG: hypothetical protein STHCBS139747_006466 [Sporothrix thermara]